MPSLTDLFNPTFLMFLGILVLVVALLVVYFESKMREQNHKITSMLSLVSSLAEELNEVKYGLNHLSMRCGVPFTQIIPPNHLAENVNERNETKLISVSDDEDTDEDELDDDDESTSHNDSVVELSDEDTILDIDESDNVKVLKLNIESNDNDDENNLETEEFNEHFSDVESLSSKSSSLSIKQTSKTFSLEENKNNSNEITQLELKTININLEEQLDSQEYKKFTLNKLRFIVSEKGLSEDSNKLKKNELLKLLGVE
jgi:cell division protein FtsL